VRFGPGRRSLCPSALTSRGLVARLSRSADFKLLSNEPVTANRWFGEALGISYPLLRRIGALEESLAVQLFHRRRQGFVLTAAGERARDAAIPLEDGVRDLRIQVQGGDAQLAGRVRVSLPDAFLPLLLRAVPRFESAYPEIALQLLTDRRFADLHQGEADVAVRIASAPDERLVGRRVAIARVGIYGSQRYAARVEGRPLASLDWLGMDSPVPSRFAKWVDDHVDPSRIRIHLATAAALEAAVEADLGVTLMPCVVTAHRHWHRFRLLEEVVAPVWVLSHPDLRTTARVRAVRDFISDALVGARTVIAGDETGADQEEVE